jgi:hypothetical protein
MAMVDSDEGQVIYFINNNFRKPIPFAVYRTVEERKKQLEKLDRRGAFAPCYRC